jgi:hypothetical protein
MPLNCFWWYANNVWDKVSTEKQSAYLEERLHEFTARKMLDVLDKKERNEFIDHIFRPGGGGIINFSKYPAARPIYEEIKKKDGYSPQKRNIER